MSRIVTPAIETAAGATAEVYAQLKNSIGAVPNTFAAIGAHGPAARSVVLQTDSVLAAGSLSKQELETIKRVVSAAAGCDYCVAAHSLLGKMAGLTPEALRDIRAGDATGDAKRDALVRLVSTRPYQRNEQ
jgi:AhpD family alkylhydroperoxidase